MPSQVRSIAKQLLSGLIFVGMDFVVPFSVKTISFDYDFIGFSVSDFTTLLVRIFVKPSVNL